MSYGLTFEMLTQISRNLLGRRRNSWKECLQNFMYIDQELSEKLAKNTQRWWKLTATIIFFGVLKLFFDFFVFLVRSVGYITSYELHFQN